MTKKVVAKKRRVVKPRVTSPSHLDKPRAVGCHIYAGAFSRGMMDGGIDVIEHLEPKVYRGFGAESSRRNLGVEVLVATPDEWRAERFKGACQFVFGNPPCAAYSNASHGRGGPWMDERRGHAIDVLRLLREVKPRAWVLESVPGILTKGGGVMGAIIEEARELGYAVTMWKHDHRFLGLAQKRARVYVICHDFDLQFPLAGRSVFDPDFRIKTVAEVLADVPDPGDVQKVNPKMRKLVKMSTSTRSPRRIWFEKFQDDPKIARPSFLTHRIPLNSPCGTIVNCSCIHPTEESMLGHLEGAALCGYPPDWDWGSGSLGGKWAEMCKASLPSGGRALAQVLIEGLRRDEPPRWVVAVVDQHAGRRVDESRNSVHVLESPTSSVRLTVDMVRGGVPGRIGG